MRGIYVLPFAVAALSVAACQPNATETTDGETPAPAGEQALEGAEQTSEMPMGPRTLFTDAEQRMLEGMMAVSAGDAAEVWARKMVAHHQGALDMSQIVLDETDDPEIRAMAERTIEMQRQDIAELERWISEQSS